MACPGCGAPLTGGWCSRCGQRAPAADDFTTRRFLAAVANELTDSDSRTWATLRNVLNPGELTRAFLAREWRRYLPPLRLYLLLSGAYFLLGWDFYYALQVADVMAMPPEAAPAQVRAVFEDPRSADLASDATAFARFAGVLVLALWVAVLALGRGRPLGAHLVFATHYYCADYVVFLLLMPVLVVMRQLGLAVGPGAVIGAGVVALLTWAVLGARRVYRMGWPRAALTGVGIIVVDLVLSSLAGLAGIAVAAAAIAGG